MQKLLFNRYAVYSDLAKVPAKRALHPDPAAIRSRRRVAAWREMFDALLADLKNGVLEGAWNARLADQLAKAAARSLNDSGLRRTLLQALLQAVASADAEEYDLTPALCTAFGMACSNMGAEVAVTGQPAAERAVLVCGFAGASLSMLSPTEAMVRPNPNP